MESVSTAGAFEAAFVHRDPTRLDEQQGYRPITTSYRLESLGNSTICPPHKNVSSPLTFSHAARHGKSHNPKVTSAPNMASRQTENTKPVFLHYSLLLALAGKRLSFGKNLHPKAFVAVPMATRASHQTSSADPKPRNTGVSKVGFAIDYGYSPRARSCHRDGDQTSCRARGCAAAS